MIKSKLSPIKRNSESVRSVLVNLEQFLNSNEFNDNLTKLGYGVNPITDKLNSNKIIGYESLGDISAPVYSNVELEMFGTKLNIPIVKSKYSQVIDARTVNECWVQSFNYSESMAGELCKWIANAHWLVAFASDNMEIPLRGLLPGTDDLPLPEGTRAFYGKAYLDTIVANPAPGSSAAALDQLVVYSGKLHIFRALYSAMSRSRMKMYRQLGQIYDKSNNKNIDALTSIISSEPFNVVLPTEHVTVVDKTEIRPQVEGLMNRAVEPLDVVITNDGMGPKKK